jgi:hypothetical protein
MRRTGEVFVGRRGAGPGARDEDRRHDGRHRDGASGPAVLPRQPQTGRRNQERSDDEHARDRVVRERGEHPENVADQREQDGRHDLPPPRQDPRDGCHDQESRLDGSLELADQAITLRVARQADRQGEPGEADHGGQRPRSAHVPGRDARPDRQRDHRAGRRRRHGSITPGTPVAAAMPAAVPERPPHRQHDRRADENPADGVRPPVHATMQAKRRARHERSRQDRQHGHGKPPPPEQHEDRHRQQTGDQCGLEQVPAGE